MIGEAAPPLPPAAGHVPSSATPGDRAGFAAHAANDPTGAAQQAPQSAA